jgi:hypothetical protein
LLALSEESGNVGKLLKENGLDKNLILSALKEIRGTTKSYIAKSRDTYQSCKNRKRFK